MQKGRIIRTSLNINGVVTLLARRQVDWFELTFKPNARCTIHPKTRHLIKGYKQASSAMDQLSDKTEYYPVKQRCTV